MMAVNYPRKFVKVPDPLSVPDGQFMKTSGGVWVLTDPPASGGGGGGGGGGLPPPVNPSVYDDEFVSGTLNAKWTVVSAPGAGFLTSPNKHGTFLWMAGPGAASGNFWEIRQTIGNEGLNTADFSATCKMGLDGVVNATQQVEMWLQDNTTLGTGNRVAGYIAQSGTNSHSPRFDDNGSLAANLGASSIVTKDAWWHIQRKASSGIIQGWYSGDGLSWHRYVSLTSNSWNITTLIVRLFAHTAAGSPSGHRVDFVRVNWLFLPDLSLI